MKDLARGAQNDCLNGCEASGSIGRRIYMTTINAFAKSHFSLPKCAYLAALSSHRCPRRRSRFQERFNGSAAEIILFVQDFLATNMERPTGRGRPELSLGGSVGNSTPRIVSREGTIEIKPKKQRKSIVNSIQPA